MCVVVIVVGERYKILLPQGAGQPTSQAKAHWLDAHPGSVRPSTTTTTFAMISYLYNLHIFMVKLKTCLGLKHSLKQPSTLYYTMCDFDVDLLDLFQDWRKAEQRKNLAEG